MERGSTPRVLRGLVSVVIVGLCGGGLLLAPVSLSAQSAWDGGGGVRGAGGFQVGGDGGGSPEAAGTESPTLRRAAERTGRGSPAAAARPSTGATVVRTLLWLVVVLGLALGTLHLIRRILPGAVTPTNRQLIRVIARAPVGPKQQIVVTQVAGRLLVLGVTPDRINRLGEITDPAEIAGAVPPEESFAARFASVQEVYGEGDPLPEWVAEAESREESRFEPYRREISRLKSMVADWRRDEPGRERGRG